MACLCGFSVSRNLEQTGTAERTISPEVVAGKIRLDWSTNQSRIYFPAPLSESPDVLILLDFDGEQHVIIGVQIVGPVTINDVKLYSAT